MIMNAIPIVCRSTRDVYVHDSINTDKLYTIWTQICSVFDTIWIQICRVLTRKSGFVKARGTRSCIRVYGSGVLAKWSYYLDGD